MECSLPMVLSPAIRIAAFLATHSGAATEIPCFDSIASGCVLALLWPKLQSGRQFLRLMHWRGFALIP